jgi:hypothetical protein
VTYVIRIPRLRFNGSDFSRSALFSIMKEETAESYDEPVYPYPRRARKKLKVKRGEK